jgi:dihydrofolate synthase/folylpolyglutamate synthase
MKSASAEILPILLKSNNSFQMALTERYAATLDFLFSRLPMFQRVGSIAFRPDLTNILNLLAGLNMELNKFPTIHIAGTNGKGSTAHLIAAMLTAQGYKTGLYISPHYVDFRERIRINGQLVSKRFVIDFTERVKPLLDEINPSFFEITWVMALAWFEKSKVDVAVIETGLGGRLDSTNVITPVLSVITNIGMDHTAFLGDTLPKIASEKAGIIKPGVPVVIGEKQEETTPVFNHFSEANLLYATYNVRKMGSNNLWFKDLKVNLAGGYQLKNVRTALCAIDKLKPFFTVENTAIIEGLLHLKRLTRFMGRWQKLGDDPLIIADSAHNTEGLTLAMNQLKEIPAMALHLVIGVVADKDIAGMLSLLPKKATYYFAKPDLPRGLNALKLKEQALSFGLYGKAYSSVKNALKAAKRKAAPSDVIYVGGSTFVVAEVIHFSYP